MTGPLRLRNSKLIRTSSGVLAVCPQPCSGWKIPPDHNPTLICSANWIPYSACEALWIEQDECYYCTPGGSNLNFSYAEHVGPHGGNLWTWSSWAFDYGPESSNVFELECGANGNMWWARHTITVPRGPYQPNIVTGYGSPGGCLLPDGAVKIKNGKISGAFQMGYGAAGDGYWCARGKAFCSATIAEGFTPNAHHVQVTLSSTPITPGSVNLHCFWTDMQGYYGDFMVTDDEYGSLSGGMGAAGTIDYNTGAVDFILMDLEPPAVATVTEISPANYGAPENFEQFKFTASVTVSQG